MQAWRSQDLLKRLLGRPVVRNWILRMQLLVEPKHVVEVAKPSLTEHAQRMHDPASADRLSSALSRRLRRPSRITPDERDEPVLQRGIVWDVNGRRVVALVHLPFPPLPRHAAKPLPPHLHLLRLHSRV